MKARTERFLWTISLKTCMKSTNNERQRERYSENSTIRRSLRSVGGGSSMIGGFDTQPFSAKAVVAFRDKLLNRRHVLSTAAPCGLAASLALHLVARLPPFPPDPVFSSSIEMGIMELQSPVIEIVRRLFCPEK